jgi:phosphoglycerate kinase
MNSVASADVSGADVIVRADLDLAKNPDGSFESLRLQRLIPTLQDLLSRGASIRLIAHRGRPEGAVDPNLSLQEIAPLLSDALSQPVEFGGDLMTNPNPTGKAVLFENLRFHPGEEGDLADFVQALLKLGTIYVNEAFAASHRSHASIVGIPRYMPHFAGLNLLKEVTTLEGILKNPARPLVVIIGGAKIETKLPIIEYMQNVADKILVGGALLAQSVSPGEKVITASDTVGGKDIGSETIAAFKQVLEGAKTIIWNGPMGVFEDPQFASGTKAVAESMVASGAFSVIGGGDTIAALDQMGFLPRISFVSTGGGAMLEFLSGKTLPGLSALS